MYSEALQKKLNKMATNEEIGARLKQLRKNAGYEATEVMSIIGGTRTRIYAWEAGNSGVSKDNLTKLAKLYGSSIEFILTGKSPQSVTEAPVAYGKKAQYAPLISLIQAGDFRHTAFDEFGDHKLFPAPAGVLRAYALKVVGDSMTSPNYPAERSFPDGCIVVVDADSISPKSGDFVIAKLSGRDETTFKQFKIDENGRPYLRPLNPQFPLMHDEFRLLGTVVRKIED